MRCTPATLFYNTGSVMENWVFWIRSEGKNMQVRFRSKMVLKSWDLRNFAVKTSFYERHAMCDLWSNLKTCRLCFLGKKSLNVPSVKLFSKNKFNVLGVFWCFFCFNFKIKVNIYPFNNFLHVISLKWPIKMITG